MRDDRSVRTTLDIDDDVLQAAKELGGLQKKTAGQILSELARKALAPAPLRAPGCETACRSCRLVRTRRS